MFYHPRDRWFCTESLHKRCSIAPRNAARKLEINVLDSNYFLSQIARCLLTEKSFRNLIKSNQNQIVWTIFRLIWNQADIVRLVSNQSNMYHRCMVNTIWFRFDLMQFWKDFSVCKLYYLFLSNWMEYDRADHIPFNLVQNWKQKCHRDHIPFNSKGKENKVFSAYGKTMEETLAHAFVFLFCKQRLKSFRRVIYNTYVYIYIYIYCLDLLYITRRGVRGLNVPRGRGHCFAVHREILQESH